MNITNLTRPEPPVTRTWSYSWKDGSAIVTQTGSYGVLWLQADLCAGHYGWGGWNGDKPGSDFRAWISDSAEHSPDYVASKLCYGHPSIFDAEKTDINVRTWICELRRSEEISSEIARELWDSWSYGRDLGEYDFYSWLDDIPNGSEYPEPAYADLPEYERWGYTRFIEHLPNLTAAIKAELARSAPHSIVSTASGFYEPDGL